MLGKCLPPAAYPYDGEAAPLILYLPVVRSPTSEEFASAENGYFPITFISPVVSLVHPSTLRENYNKREALRWTDKIFEEQKDLDKLTLQIEEFKRAMDKMTNAQKEKEMSAIELLIKEQELKQDHSFLQSLFRKKSA